MNLAALWTPAVAHERIVDARFDHHAVDGPDVRATLEPFLFYSLPLTRWRIDSVQHLAALSVDRPTDMTQKSALVVSTLSVVGPGLLFSPFTWSQLVTTIILDLRDDFIFATRLTREEKPENHENFYARSYHTLLRPQP